MPVAVEGLEASLAQSREESLSTATCCAASARDVWHRIASHRIDWLGCSLAVRTVPGQGRDDVRLAFWLLRSPALVARLGGVELVRSSKLRFGLTTGYPGQGMICLKGQR